MNRRLFLLASAATAAFAAPAAAQTAAPADPVEPAQDHVHQQAPPAIIVTAPFVQELDLITGTSILAGEELVRELRPTLGDTLARQPGVSATSFAPGSSRPVLRGFQGARVRVLTDGIGALDAAASSVDHAVSIDPITADRIEVLHGPAVLLFGSEAIGGAVNVFDRRIPRVVPDDALHIDAIAAYGTAADERSVAAGVDTHLGGGLVLHVDGSWRKTDDLEVGGFVLSPELRAEQLEIAEEELEEGHVEEAEEALELANLRGVLPNSATETWTAGAGLALIRDRGNLGFSVGVFDTRYGVPMRPGAEHHHGEEEEGHEDEHGHEDEDEHGHEDDHGHGHGEEPVSIDLRQVRADLRGEIETGDAGFIERLRVRLGAADYEHTEFEGDEVGTVFLTTGLEGRAELVQRERSGWRGVIGGQVLAREFEAIGAEAFVPPNETSQIGLFTLQEVEFGAFQAEAAARYEHSGVDATTLGLERRFDAISLAAGLSHEPMPGIRFGANLSRSERAPSAEELYSDGPHIATQAFERGDPGLDTERSVGGELYFRAERPTWRAAASLYYNSFDDFIFQAATGEEEDELPVFQYFQRDATWWGFEVGGGATVARFGGWRIEVDGVADYVRATLADDGGPLPRIPPLRLLGGVEAGSSKFTARGEVERVFEQDRVAEFENPTDDYTLVNASLTWRPWGRRNPTSFTLAANNIFDVEARRHASFTKDFVPLAGRDIRLGARFSF